MYFTVYKITNKINGKFYIGKHQTKNINDHYMGSGKAIRAALKYYGRSNFEKTILKLCANENEMNLFEKQLVTEELVNNTNSYNLGVGGEGGPHFKGKQHSAVTKEKIRQNYKYTPWSNERKIAHLLRMKNCVSRGQKVSAAQLGKPKSEEHKKKISESLKKTKQKQRI